MDVLSEVCEELDIQAHESYEQPQEEVVSSSTPASKRKFKSSPATLELLRILKMLPEDDAKQIIEVKMARYKLTYNHQIAEIKNLVRTKRMLDRRVKSLQQVLNYSIRDENIRFIIT